MVMLYSRAALSENRPLPTACAEPAWLEMQFAGARRTRTRRLLTTPHILLRRRAKTGAEGVDEAADMVVADAIGQLLQGYRVGFERLARMLQPLIAEHVEHRGAIELAEAGVEPPLAEAHAAREVGEGGRVPHVAQQPLARLVHGRLLAA